MYENTDYAVPFEAQLSQLEVEIFDYEPPKKLAPTY